MPIRRVKDLSGLVAQAKLSSQDGHYWHVYIWRDTAAFLEATYDNDKSVLGCHCCRPVLLDPESSEPLPSKKMGEVHFISREWTMEIVAHELLHALFHRLKYLCPSYKAILERDDMGAEETVCYEYGRWFHGIYKWLWEVDPPPNWRRTDWWLP